MKKRKMNLTEDYKKRLHELAGIDGDVKKITAKDINEIMKGYLTAALWTEEERLADDFQEISGMSGHYVDEEPDDDETEMDKFIRLKHSFNSKSLESFSQNDIEEDSLIQAYLDIKKFLELAGDSVYEAIEYNGLQRLGHDIWLTRNHHGSGFFDHNYEHGNEKSLMSAAKAIGSVDLFINDNMKLSFSNER